MVLTAAIMWLFPRAVLSIYIDVDAARNVALVGYAMQFLVIAAAFQLFDGAQTVAAGVLRGLQDTRVPKVLAVGGYWLAGSGPPTSPGFWTPPARVVLWIGHAGGPAVAAAPLR